jgi:histidine triad (HIT) family protein
MASPGAPPDAPCVFCDIIAGRSPAHVIYEDQSAIAFLDIFPFTRGHLLVVPKHHGARLTDLGPPERAGLIHALDEVCRRVDRITSDYNVALNAGARAGQVVFHVHFHVIPRYGEANPFQPRARKPLDGAEAKRLVDELSAP